MILPKKKKKNGIQIILGFVVFFFFFEKLGLCDLCLLDQINMGHTIVFSTTIVTCFVEGTNHCTKPDF